MAIEVPEIADYNDFTFFAVLVDGEYTGKVGIAGSGGPVMAGMKSNPTIVEMTQEQVNVVQLGWTYDGIEFIAPTA
jgi:hypothetical protein